jgi:ethanolamine utilization protein EutQ
MDTILNENMIAEIVRRVLAEMNAGGGGLQVSRDPGSGVMSVSGGSVRLEPFDTGTPGDKVFLKDIITSKDNDNIAAGFMTIEKCEFPWTLTYDEIDYVIEGELTIKVVNGKDISGKAGDVIMIPKNTSIKFSAPEYAKFIYITYPANWAEA